MLLEQLIAGAPPEARHVEISALAYDNRTVVPGTLFFCVPGFTRDGHDFALDSVNRGAAALVVQRPLEIPVPQVVVADVRAAMAPAAAVFFGHPTDALTVVGVTGTNGKTTSAFLLRSLLEADGRQTGLLGTVTSVIGGVARPVARTTPEAIDLQRIFREMLDAGDRACAIEVSSHALELHRADAVAFAAAIFTNLTQDHLDFHPTMEDYFAAKRRLFTELRPRAAIINIDDAYGRRLAGELDEPITFSLQDPRASYLAEGVETGIDGSRLRVNGRKARSRSSRRCVAASTSTTCSERSRPLVRSECRSQPPRRRSSRPVRFPDGLSSSMRDSRSRCSSITRTRRIRCRTFSALLARCRRGRCTSSSAAAGTVTAASDR